MRLLMRAEPLRQRGGRCALDCGDQRIDRFANVEQLQFRVGALNLFGQILVNQGRVAEGARGADQRMLHLMQWNADVVAKHSAVAANLPTSRENARHV